MARRVSPVGDQGADDGAASPRSGPRRVPAPMVSMRVEFAGVDERGSEYDALWGPSCSARRWHCHRSPRRAVGPSRLPGHSTRPRRHLPSQPGQWPPLLEHRHAAQHRDSQHRRLSGGSEEERRPEVVPHRAGPADGTQRPRLLGRHRPRTGHRRQQLHPARLIRACSFRTGGIESALCEVARASRRRERMR
jgi:hypothetical protein